ncbi:MAG: DUF1365 domain-containing protein [Sedimentisphaerales bacterium]|nr:DUF1365 domain-containing protein [Sedimentisphaerales bacterium]
MHSAIYEGQVRHRRFGKVQNHFEYRLFMMYLDLGELEAVFHRRWLWSIDRWNLACFRRSDHLGDPGISLDCAVRKLIRDRTGVEPSGPIRLLTHLRYIGHCFNPVSFYYCFNKVDSCVETIVAEINNTPWHQRHCHVLTEDTNEDRDPWKQYRFKKDFHVSPFMDMDLDYQWRFLQPCERIQVHMQNIDHGTKLFDATLSLRRTEITGPALVRLLLRYPAMTVQVVTHIYWQALRLWLKGATFYTHPDKKSAVEGKP